MYNSYMYIYTQPNVGYYCGIFAHVVVTGNCDVHMLDI